MLIYLIVIALSVILCIVLMGVVRELPEAIKGEKKMGKSAYIKLLSGIAIAILLTVVVSSHRCANCGNLGASREYAIDGRIFCEKCYEDITG